MKVRKIVEVDCNLLLEIDKHGMKIEVWVDPDLKVESSDVNMHSGSRGEPKRVYVISNG